MKKSTALRSLLICGLSLLLCLAMFAGTTFAWFTDSVESGNNKIVAGNLDVELYNAIGKVEGKEITNSTELFEMALWEPGAMVYENLTVANEGTLALKYQLAVNVANATKNENGDTLAEVLKVAVVDGGIAEGTTREILEGLTTYTALASFSESDTLAVNGTKTYGIVIWWEPSDKDNQFNMNNENQGKTMSIELGVNLFATQVSVDTEKDSFDETYDEEAPLIFTTSAVALPTGGVAATEDKTLVSADDSAVTLTLSANFLNALAEDDDAPESVALSHAKPQIDTVNKTITFDYIDLVDENGEVVDLEAMGNTESVTVELNVGDAFAEGEVAFIYHDGEYYARATIGADGTLSYEADHFCEVVISDTMTVKVNSAADLIAALTEIKTEAKKQIPGENGNKKYRENAVFVLENDIVVESAESFMYTDSNGGAFHFYGVKGVLDLNGHSITVTENALLSGKAHANAVLLVQYSNIQIVGEGSIIAKNKSIPVYGWANGSVDIYNGNYITNAPERNESAVYVNNSSMLINVYGGTYMDTAYAFNAHDSSCKETAVITLHEGITYADFFKNETNNLILSDINGGRIVFAEGCEAEATEVDGVTVNVVVKK